MQIAAFTRIPCVVQVGHHYSATMAHYPVSVEKAVISVFGLDKSEI